MSGRPEILFPLFGALTGLPKIGDKTARLLAALSIATPRDLLFTLPHGVIDRRPVRSLRDLPLPAVVTVEVEVLRHLPPARSGGPHRILVRDAATDFTLVFFHQRGPALEKMLPVGATRIVSGKAEPFDGAVQMVHPDHVLAPKDADALARHEPVYPLTAGLSAKGMVSAVRAAIARAPDLPEWIDPALLAREGWPGWRAALVTAHAPEGLGDLALTAPARARLAYDELFSHQLTLSLARARARARPGRVTRGSGQIEQAIRAALPYQPTAAQERCLAEIAGDMAAPRRMNRLLQGDVGSGKTLVALLALVIAVEAGGQGVLMAPTEILARQHLETLAPLAAAAGLRLALLTGRDRPAEREATRASVSRGEVDVLIGTHSVFQDGVAFADLRLAVIDEQHKFGVEQRKALGAKGEAVDVLVMTATPIPRSLRLTQFGEMDVSIIDTKPPGRTPVTTALLSDERIDEVIAHLRTALAEGQRAYWVCPLVDDSDLVDLASAEQRFLALQAAFGEAAVRLVHGQMPAEARDAAMADFVAGRARVLVATTVIEVGVNVPEASIMIIERADSFGLAQLHQLRGRVGRGSARSTCLLLYRAPLSETARRRLETLRRSEDGFRIAEEDLAIRGAGDMIGTAQSGLPRFRIADLERQSGLLAIAQDDARLLLTLDPELRSERGEAARILLWLMERDKAIGLLSIG